MQVIDVAQMRNINGGFVITGAMIVSGLTCLGTGVACGYAFGKMLRWLF